MWCCRRLEKISWTDRVRNGEVLQRVKGERNIIHTVKRRKVNWIGHILRRNCLLKHDEGKKGRADQEEDVSRYWMTLRKRGYWKSKEEALDRTVWRTRRGRGYGPVVRQTAE
jgi:hypothetical protein